MVFGLLGIANMYFFLTGLFNSVNPPTDTAVIPAGSKKYNKVVYLLMDALRIDSSIRTSKEGHIYNKMEYLHSIRSKFHALSISGVPTETRARVLGLATGMPSNFLSSALTLVGSSVKTDNIVRQLDRNGSIAFFGDNEWIDFFPELGSKPHHTMDPYGKHKTREKENFIIERILEGVNNYDAIIAHLINLDSYGHMYGTEHEIMGEQLVIYDNLIRDVYEKMSDDTLLVVCSDHGVNNDGAHGGLSTMEMSSVGIFISKDERLTNIATVDAGLAEIRKRHITRFYQENPGEIMGEEPYMLIHQDDILPTMCYLMGIPIPRMSGGNFIPELVQDLESYKIFAKQKCELLRIPFNDVAGSLYYYIRLNYELSEKIFHRYAGRNNLKLAVSGIISIITAILLLVRFSRIKFDKAANLALSFTFIMTAHSVYAIIHEDLFWSTLFLVSNPSLRNALGVVLLLQMVRPPSDPSKPLFEAMIGGIKLSSLFNGNLAFVLELCVFSILNNMENFRRSLLFPLNSILRMFNSHPQILLSLLRYFFHDKLNDHNLRLTLLLSSPSIDTILALMFRPMESIYLIYISRNLKIKNNLYTYFPLVNMAVFSSGLQKLLPSINYEVFFTFSDGFVVLPAIAIAACYLIYPRIRAISRFRTGRGTAEASKGSILLRDDILMFQSFNLLLVMWSGYAICDSLSFYRFLANRIFFECFYYLCDFILLLITSLTKKSF